MKVFSNRQGDVVQFERGGALQPMQNGVALVGKTGTLFFLGKGLYEYAKSAGCPLGVTLLRGAGEIASGHFTMYETGGGQCLGRVKIEYAFGLADSLTRASFLKRVMEFRLPPRVWQTFGETPPATGMSVCSVSNLDWIVTGIKTPEQGRGIVVRVVNLSDRAQTGTLQFALPAARAVLSRLDETRVKELPLKGGAVRLSLGARQIATVVFEQA
jgi:alpha-mannosidase